MKRFLLFIFIIFFVQIAQAKKTKVACIGNSITFGSGIANRDKNCYPAQLQVYLGETYEVQNFGVSGRTLLHQGDYPYIESEGYKKSLAFDPDIVLIKLGTNDSKPQNIQYLNRFKSDLLALIGDYANLASKPRIILLTPLRCFLENSPINNKVIQRDLVPIIQQVAYEQKIEIIDMYHLFGDKHDASVLPDKLHPSSIGAGVMAKHLYEYLSTGHSVNFCIHPVCGNEFRSGAGWKEGADWHIVAEDISKTLQKEQIDLLLLGNSITQGFGGSRQQVTYKPGKEAATQIWEGVKWESAGISGDRTQHLLWRIQNGDYNISKPKHIVITIGINNLNDKDDVQDVAEGIQAVALESRKQFTEAQILLFGLLPSGANKDDAIRLKCDAVHNALAEMEWEGVLYVNPTQWFVNADGSLKNELYGGDFLHLNENGYKTWSQHIKEIIF